MISACASLCSIAKHCSQVQWGTGPLQVSRATCQGCFNKFEPNFQREVSLAGFSAMESSQVFLKRSDLLVVTWCNCLVWLIWFCCQFPCSSACPKQLRHIWFTEFLPTSSTVDGSEIRCSPVDMVHVPLFTRFYTSQVVVLGFLNHQRYHLAGHDTNVLCQSKPPLIC